MPDLSAGRPLPLPEDRIEALVREFSAAAIRNYATPSDVLGFLEGNAILEGYSSIEELTPLIEAISGGMYRAADAIEAGAALPPSAEHREEEEEFMVAGDLPDGTPWVSDPHHRLGDARQLAAMMAPGAVIKRRLVSAGPWVEVDGGAE